MGRGVWVVGCVCLKINKRYLYINISSLVRGSNLQLPAHELISPNSFYETLKTISVNFNESVRKYMLNFGVRDC